MRDLISFVCDGCKRKNYTTHQEQEEDHGEARVPQVLPLLPQPRAAQGGEGLNVAPRRLGVSSSNW